MMNLTRDEKVFEFISFCIENFKVKFKMKGKAVIDVTILH